MQHVTFHLADSLPAAVLRRLRDEVRELERKKTETAKTETAKTPIGRLAFPGTFPGAELRRRVEAWMDAGYGSCVLRVPRIAAMVQGSLLAFDSLRYRVLAWVVMPNHVHVLFEPLEGWSVAGIVASWKKFTARGICDYRREGGQAADEPVWHREYWDRYIRDQGHFDDVVAYIEMNPVKAGLVRAAAEWRWGSAYLRRDGKVKR